MGKREKLNFLKIESKKSDTALTGLETSDVRFVRLRSRSGLLIANKLTSEF